MKTYFHISLIFVLMVISLAMSNIPPPNEAEAMLENKNLTQYQLVGVTEKNQVLLTFNGTRIDLAKINDAEAGVLYRSGCKLVCPIEPPTVDIANYMATLPQEDTYPSESLPKEGIIAENKGKSKKPK